jgi:hypothetical protein
MNLDERNLKANDGDAEDLQVTAALRNFRESVHGWSEQEFSKTRTSRVIAPHGFWVRMRGPVAGWALGCVVAMTAVTVAVTVPVTVHRQHKIAEERIAQQEQIRLADEKAKLEAANSMTDEELLSHVDSDIAQATPDAMEPLASMMRDTNRK